MKPLLAFIKKEYLEAARTGKITILALLFVLFGIMNPAIAKPNGISILPEPY